MHRAPSSFKPYFVFHLTYKDEIINSASENYTLKLIKKLSLEIDCYAGCCANPSKSLSLAVQPIPRMNRVGNN